jgi:hypothetical protein
MIEQALFNFEDVPPVPGAHMRSMLVRHGFPIKALYWSLRYISYPKILLRPQRWAMSACLSEVIELGPGPSSLRERAVELNSLTVHFRPRGGEQDCGVGF